MVVKYFDAYPRLNSRGSFFASVRLVNLKTTVRQPFLLQKYLAGALLDVSAHLTHCIRAKLMSRFFEMHSFRTLMLCCETLAKKEFSRLETASFAFNNNSKSSPTV